MSKVSEVIDKYLQKTKISYREFSGALNESLVNASVTHVTVSNWKSGVYEPGTDFLVLMLLKYRDWRFDFALECLAAKEPDVWGVPNGGIWKVARKLPLMAGSEVNNESA